MNKKFYLSVWRWHFFAGLYVIPFMLMLSVTGLIMLASPWVDSWQYGDELTTVSPPDDVRAPLSFEQQLVRVKDVYPEFHVAQFIPPITTEQSSLFKVKGTDGTILVFVNPYTGNVLGEFNNADRLYTISDSIHGTLLLGETGDMLIELAAGLGFLLVITGIYLHWPKGNTALGSMLIPYFIRPSFWMKRAGNRKRVFWRSIHGSAGLYLSLFLVFFLLTGMSWTGIWGQRLVQPWNTFPPATFSSNGFSSEKNQVAEHHAELNTDELKEVPWNLELTPMPASHIHPADDGIQRLSVDQVYDKAIQLGFEQKDKGAMSDSFRIALPKDDSGAFTLFAVTMSGDISNPFGDRTVHLDQYSGEVLADIRWDDYNTIAKTMAAGIAFHQGDAGWWNVILVLLVCVGLILLSVTGVVLWWKRRSQGTRGLAAPPQQVLENIEAGHKMLIALTVLTGVLFPLSGVAMLVFSTFEKLQYMRDSRRQSIA